MGGGRGDIFPLEFGYLLAKASDWESLRSDTGKSRSQRCGKKSKNRPTLSTLLGILLC